MSKTLFTRTALFTWVAGALTTLLGLCVLVSWILQQATLIRIHPGWPEMVINTAVCFLCSGLSLLLAPLRKWRAANVLRTLLLGFQIFLCVAVFLEIWFGLDSGISLAEFHRDIQTVSKYPGRMSPTSSMGFLLFGIGSLLYIYSKKPLSHAIVRWLTLCVFIIGLFGLTEHLLDLPNLYPDVYRTMGLIGMAFHTACGLIFLSFGLWGLWYHAYLRSLGSDDIDVRRIYHSTAFVICTLGLATGMTGFAFLQNALKNENSSSLLRLQTERANLFATVLDHRLQRALVASNLPTVRELFQKLYANPDDQAAFAMLQDWSQGLLNAGFSGVAAEVNGRHYQQVGQSIGDQVFSIPLAGTYPGELSWHNGYYLKMRYPVRDGNTGIIYGHVQSEQPIQVLDSSQADILHWGTTGEMVVCALSSANRPKCFPSRFAPQPVEIPDTSVRGRLLPMAYALRNETGVKISDDYRGRPVIAGHGPVGTTGLGLVVKMDLSEIYGPIRQRLEWAVPVIIALMLFGLWLTRARIRPLVQKQVSMRAAAEKERSYFVTAAESSPDAFFILESCKDKSGQITDFKFSYLNHNVRHVFPNVTAEVTGTSFLEKFPHRFNFFDKGGFKYEVQR